MQIFDALMIIKKQLAYYFNSPDDEILLQISNDYISGYIVSAKFYNLTDNQRKMIFQNILRNFSTETNFFGSIILLSSDEKDHVDKDVHSA